MAVWYADNTDRARAYHQQHRLNNHEQFLEKDRAYWEENKDQRNEQRRNRYAATREKALASQLQYRQGIRAQVFDHYGWQCACCGSTVALQIDHVAGNGTQHRRELFGSTRGASGTSFYAWLIRNDFPEGYQTLCHPCNASKHTGTHCRLDHTERGQAS